MKKLFTILACAAAMVACENDEIVRQDLGDAIEFGNAFVDNATRVDPSYATDGVTTFKLYGTVNGGQSDVLIYPGATVTKGTADFGAAWTVKKGDQEIKQYWIPGANYKFVGIVDGDVTDVTETNLVNGMPTTISYTANGTTDLLCETITRDGDTSIVAFTFKHLLAKAKFTVVNNTPDATNYLHKVRDIKIVNAYNTATYNVTTEAWANQASTTGQAFDNIVAQAASTECENEKLLIPGLTSVTVEFVVDLYYVENGSETLVSTTEYTVAKGTAKTATIDIEAGHAYNFKAEVAVGQLITFSATEMTDWANWTPVTL